MTTCQTSFIDDNPTLRSELTSALSQASFTVASVPDYPEALLKLDEFNPDMVIVEVLLSRDGKFGFDGLKIG